MSPIQARDGLDSRAQLAGLGKQQNDVLCFLLALSHCRKKTTVPVGLASWHTHGLAHSSGRNNAGVPLIASHCSSPQKALLSRRKELSPFPDGLQGRFSCHVMFREQVERRSSADLSRIDKTDLLL